MNLVSVVYRSYCKVAPIPLSQNLRKKKLDFANLVHLSKIPAEPIKSNFSKQHEVSIDFETIQSLERLSLVNLDGEEALNTIRNSIQFAENIANIDTENIAPLYTVLYCQSLRLRADQVKEGNTRDLILQNSKVNEEDYFISPPGNIPLNQ